MRWGDSDYGDWKSRAYWAVILTPSGKLVTYRFEESILDEPRTGVIQIYDSWPEFERAVPAKIFEAALLEAEIKKPVKYREVRLDV